MTLDRRDAHIITRLRQLLADQLGHEDTGHVVPSPGAVEHYARALAAMTGSADISDIARGRLPSGDAPQEPSECTCKPAPGHTVRKDDALGWVYSGLRVGRKNGGARRCDAVAETWSWDGFDAGAKASRPPGGAEPGLRARVEALLVSSACALPLADGGWSDSVVRVSEIEAILASEGAAPPHDALRHIARQHCTRSGDERCGDTSDCVTEYCYPCYARAHVKGAAPPETTVPEECDMCESTGTVTKGRAAKRFPVACPEGCAPKPSGVPDAPGLEELRELRREMHAQAQAVGLPADVAMVGDWTTRLAHAIDRCTPGDAGPRAALEGES